MRTFTETTNVSSTNSTNTNSSGQYAVNDRVEVLDASQNKWFGAIILKVNSDGTYLVAYDGYADTCMMRSSPSFKNSSSYYRNYYG
ncbi:MAG: hypothetical protein IPG07_21285 [Crocinitomicaceae bacterium]|nr:hypothetical protein [Crocinitomicaceae bacterium]